jgi:DNA-binding response OmpR family regulator
MTSRLAGKRILIVEDEPLIAENLAFELAAAGAQVIGRVATVTTALDVIAKTGLDGVTLNINLIGERAYAVADALVARNIPFVFVTGYDAEDVPPHHANIIRVEKPATPAVVCRALETILAARSSPPRAP